jgi:hypothetical protein
MSNENKGKQDFVLSDNAVTIYLKELNENVADFIYLPATKNVQKGQELEFMLGPALKNAAFKVIFVDGSPLDQEISTTARTKGRVKGPPGCYHYKVIVTYDKKIFVDFYCPTIIVNN